MNERKNTTKQLATQPITPILLALRAACGDVGCNWVSSVGNDTNTDLTEVCGGSGYWSRPIKALK